MRSNANQAKTNIFKLPHFLLRNTFFYLNIKECTNLGIVSKKFKEFSEDNILWQFHLKVHYPDYLKYIQSTNQQIDYRKKFQILCTYEYKPGDVPPSFGLSDAVRVFFGRDKLPERNEIKAAVQKRELISDISVLIELVGERLQPVTNRIIFKPDPNHHFRFIYWCRYVKNRQDLLDYFYMCVENSNLGGSQGIINQLIWAALFNQETAVDSFIQNPSTNLEVTTLSWKTPLYVAACAGHCNMVAKLLNAKANVNGDAHHEQPIIHVANIGHANIVALLIERKADADIYYDKYDGTPISYAASYGYVQTMSHLLAANANPNRNIKLTPLFLSASRCLPAVKLLLEHKADPNFMCIGKKPFEVASDEETKRLILIARIEKHIDTLMSKIPKVPNLFSEKANVKIKNEVEASRKLKEICMNGWHDSDEEAYQRYHKYWKGVLSELYKDACKLNVVSIPKRPNCTIM